MAIVLIIDDDEHMRAYLQALLERAGHLVRALADGTGVRAALYDGAVDAVVTDLYMPNTDGIETLRLLNRLPRRVPVVCVTGNAGGTDDPCAKMMALLGAEVVMRKPFQPAELLDALARVLAPSFPPLRME